MAHRMQYQIMITLANPMASIPCGSATSAANVGCEDAIGGGVCSKGAMDVWASSPNGGRDSSSPHTIIDPVRQPTPSMMGPPPSSASTSTSTLLVDRKPVPHALWQPTATSEPAVPPLPDSRAQSAHAAESAFRAANQDSFYHRPYDSSGGPKKLRARRTIDYFGEVGKWNLVSWTAWMGGLLLVLILPDLARPVCSPSFASRGHTKAMCLIPGQTLSL